MPAFSNPFTKIVHEAQTAPARPNRGEHVGKTAEGVFGKERRAFDLSLQTPQKRPRPFQTPGRDTVSTLSPYVNLLNGPKLGSTPAPQFRSRDFQRPMTPRQLSSSPVQEQWLHNELAIAVGLQGKQKPFRNSPDESAIEELKDVYRSLSDQTRQAENLRYQNISLRNARENLARQHEQTTQELEVMKTGMGEATGKISTLQSQLERTDATLNAKSQELSESCEVAKAKTEENSELSKRLEVLTLEMEEVRGAYSQEVAKGEVMMARTKEANRRIQELVTAYEALEQGLHDLGQSQDAYRRLVDETSKDVSAVRQFSSEANAKISSLVDGGSNKELLSNAKTVIAELKDELADSRRVNDLLRDKLHHTSTQLADVANRARELEDEKREVWGHTLQTNSRNAELQESLITSGASQITHYSKKIEELTSRLRVYEEEGMVILARSAELEAKMTQVSKQNDEQEAELVTLRPLRLEKVQLQVEIADLTRKLADEAASRAKIHVRLEDSKDALISVEKELLVVRTQLQDAVDSRREVASELSSLKISHKGLEINLSSARDAFVVREKDLQARYETQLSELQDMVHKRDQEITALQTKRESGEDLREQLRAALSQEQAMSTRLQQELKETSIREAMAVGKVDIYEARTTHLTREVELREEMLRQLNSKVISTQERYEVQASTLRLTKDDLANTQERLLSTHTNHEAAIGALRVEIAVLQEQKSSLSLTLDGTRQEMKVQEDAFAKQLNELQTTVATQKADLQRVNGERDKCLVAAEKKTMKIKQREEELVGKITQLEGVVATNASKHEEACRIRALEQNRILELSAQVAALEKGEEEIVERQKALLERYRAGDLSDVEKDFVSLLFQHAQDLHEQAAVAKDNEIKRRDAMLFSLQARITELESSLVYTFQPADVEPNPSTILNLKESPPANIGVDPPPGARDAVSPPAGMNVPLIPLGAISPHYSVDGHGLFSSQMPSELSTPPQSPQQSSAKEIAVSFVRLSNEESEGDDSHTGNVSLKRAAENARVEGAASKKRSVVHISVSTTLTKIPQRITAMKKANQEGAKISAQAPEQSVRGRQRRKKGTT
ncbi:hypothetical protein P691DRAFT_773695 [Macrolepiota fuliginosa MF-IS2]|uniref:Uncharacterized protein n=1 Tax=Macrolepiota fuliginosa MF-IS2 TaxID=1400762 RepID=A0A9P5XJH4_9AGAR|nr:hypothetical protein P691DRAFT_773695 [Macrolepiota fuliginosa MF-IS2]